MQEAELVRQELQDEHVKCGHTEVMPTSQESLNSQLQIRIAELENENAALRSRLQAIDIRRNLILGSAAILTGLVVVIGIVTA